MELLHVDGKVLGDVIEEEFTEGLGLRVAVGGARVVFCSAEVTGEVYSEYDRILLDDNKVPLKLPVRSGGSYPSSYGIGVGRGLERNVVTIVIESAVAVQALRVTPSCELRVSIASSIGSEALLFVGSTSGGGSESSLVLSTPSSVTSPLIVLQTTESRVDVIELLRVELFTEETNLPFSTFPIRDDGMALAFTQSAYDSAEVFRRGGLLEGEATVWTVAMRPPVRQRGKRIFLASVEEAYRQEVSLYQAIAAECDRIFPVLSRIERNAQMHEEVTRDAILSLTPVSVGLTARMSVRRHGVNDLLIEEEVSPSVVDLVAGIVYQFTEAMEVDGETCLEVRLAVGEVRSYGIGGVALGLFRAGEEVTPRDLFSLPEIFMGASPLKDVVTDLAGVEGTLPVLTGRTPNEGNVISHVAFVDREGRELTCEESLFLPAASAEVSVICSSAGLELEILVDGVAVMSMTTSTGVSIVSIELPYASGVHALASSFGSNVLFRISDPVVVHAPMHPAFYTSGQLDGDTRTSSQRTIIAQNPNLDLDLDVVLSVRTEATLISAPTVLVERKDFCCSHALFARYSHVDLKAATNAEFVGASMIYCADTPWLACLNMTMGYALVHAEVLLDNFSMYYLPPPPGGDVVIVQGTHCLSLEGGELVLSRVGQGSYRTSGLSTMESWMHLCFTGGSFYIDGSRLETEYDASYEPPYLPSGSVGSTVFGCIPQLELTGFPKSLPSLMRGRARELRVVLTHPTRINSFTMFSSTGDITWTNDDTGSLPQQSFTTAVVDLPDITGLSLSSHIPATLLSSQCGSIRNVCTYTTTIPLTTIAYSAEQRDSVVDFAPKTVLFTCTNDEQTTIRSEQYVQGVLPRSPAIREFTNSSFYVTPPSLVLLSTNQTTPYSLAQSILLLFNRRIELFEKDSSTLFTISSADNSEQFLIRAHSVSLLSSQISIPNSALSLSPDTQYKIHLAAGRLFNFDGHVPCVEATIEFSTI